MDSRRSSSFSRSQGSSSGSEKGETVEVDLPYGLQIGDTIGGTYFIVSLLGAGGMGQVFEVEHIMLRQSYALKILTNDNPNTSSWRRFQTEARTIAKLDHANIIKVHNLGIHAEKTPYYVMELLVGDSLASLIKREGPLRPGDVADLFLPICDGLSYAHRHGIIHRDIKPSNIMLVEQKGKLIPKLVDFGLVKLVGGALSPSQQLTATGEVFGSPLYMSPEQCNGRHVSERTDIYSLGCTMFEALTGAPPFVGENVVQTILKHQNEHPPSLREASMGEEFSPEWEAIMSRCLTKEASERYQSMDELANDLRAMQAGKKLSAAYIKEGGDLFNSDDAAGRSGETAKSQTNIARLATMILSAVAIFLLGVGAASLYFVKLENKKPVEGHVDSLALGAVQKAEPVRQGNALNMELEDVNKPFLQADGGASGSTPAAARTYKFADDVSIGDLSYVTADGQNHTAEAKGTVVIPAGVTMTFEAGKECGIHPKIFRKFNRSDLQALVLPNTTSDTDDLLHYIDHLTEIGILNAGGTDITARGLALIGAMPALKTLVVAKTKLTGADLATLKNLANLSQLNVSGISDIRTLLEALKGSKSIEMLTLDQVKLDGDDIKLISQMPGLMAVSLTDCHLKDSDLEPLLQLPRLQNMMLRGNQISPQFIDIFKNSKSLAWIELCRPEWNEADLARFDETFKRRYKFRDLPSAE